jgi:hypothetical protein
MQLNLAVHDYMFTFEALPAGVTDTKGPIRNEPQGLHVSWIVQILPYMEELTLARLFDDSAGAYAAENAEVRATSISILMCPSNPGERTDETDKIAYSSYAGCYNDVEEPIDVDNRGLLFLNSKVRYDEIYDGSSKTLLLSEKLNTPNDLGWVSGTRATLRNTSKIEERQPRFGQPAAGEEDPAKQEVADSLYVGGFGGYHPGVVNAALADGSARAISETIEPAILQLLGNRADGKIVKPF